MSKCKTKVIQTDLGTFRHNQKYTGITQAYSELCVTPTHLKLWYIQNPDIQNQKYIKNPGILTTVIYLESQYIQNADMFKIWSIFRTLSNIYEEAFCKNSLWL